MCWCGPYKAAGISDWSAEEKVRRIYRRDLIGVCRARFLLANLDGAIPDDGVCAEVAIAGMHKLMNLTSGSSVIEAIPAPSRWICR